MVMFMSLEQGRSCDKTPKIGKFGCNPVVGFLTDEIHHQ